MKFKVGEKVRVREDLEVDKEYGCLISNSEMVKLKGQIFEIEAISCDDDKLIGLKDENRFNWTEFMLEPVEEKEDLVNHPKHYTYSNHEPIDVIKAWNLDFDLGNVVKYIARCEHKGNKLLDLQKALEYLQHEIKYLEDK